MPNSPINIMVANSLAGSGKTYWLARRANNSALQGQKVVVVQPTMALIAATIRDEISSCVQQARCVSIDSSNTNGSVTKSIMNFLETEAQSSAGVVLFITHASFFNLPFFSGSANWILMIDEVPTADRSFEIQVPENHDFITDNITIEDFDGTYSRMLVGSQRGALATLKKLAENKSDDAVNAVFSELASALISDKWNCFVRTTKFSQMLGGTELKLEVHAVMNPLMFADFKSVIILSAFVDSSLLVKHFEAISAQSNGLDIKINEITISDLRYHQHANGNGLDIYYLSEHQWSKYARDRLTNYVIDADDLHNTTCIIPFIDAVARDIAFVFNQEPFLWIGNNDKPDDLFHRVPNEVPCHLRDQWLSTMPAPTRLSGSPHGLNQYQDFNNVVILSALNPTPAHGAFLKAVGIDRDDVREAVGFQAAYQAVMRCSLRNPQNLEPKMVIVPDRACAEWLQGVFVGSKVAAFPTSEAKRRKRGPVKRFVNAAERKNASRQRATERARLALVNKLLNGLIPSREYVEPIELNGLLLDGHRPPFDAGVGVYMDIESSVPDAMLPWTNPEDFIEALRAAWKTTRAKKSDNILISPAVFDPSLSTTNRGRANVVYAQPFLIFDNDGGSLSPDAFAALFPHYQMVLANTYSNAKTETRWRVVLFVDGLMTTETYKIVVDHIFDGLRDAGYLSQKELKNAKGKHHGFDMGKLEPHCLFYLPCQSRCGDDYSFFHDLSANREPIQLARLIDAYQPSVATEEPSAAPRSLPIKVPSRAVSPAMKALQAQMATAGPVRNIPAEIARAIEVWRNAPKGEGSREFFKLAVKLRNIGLDDFDIRNHLHQEANFGNSPSERKKDIPSIMNKL